MNLKEQIQTDIKAALKSGQKETVSVLRMLSSALKNAEIAKREELTADEMLEIAAKEAKKWEEAAKEFERVGRSEQADREREDAAIIRKYLPPPLSEEELKQLVANTIAETGASGPQDIGKVMKAIMTQVKGQADGAKINALVRGALTRT